MNETKAFNQGYQLAKLDSKVAKNLLARIDQYSSENMQFFKAGVEQFNLEMTRKQIQDIEKSRSQNKSRSRKY